MAQLTSAAQHKFTSIDLPALILLLILLFLIVLLIRSTNSFILLPVTAQVTTPLDHPLASASSSSSSTCSASKTSYPHYHAFINHRGPDVKNTFARNLYKTLKSCGVRVFLDKPEMVEGHPITSQIKSAIETASVHIAIFSESYAKSSWCLDELVHMVNSGTTILPVFYKVEPSVVRWTGKDSNGEYAKALRNHEEKQRCDFQTVQNWRKALSRVADISGFELKAHDGEEEENRLLNNVVLGVLRNVPKTPLDVAKHPTGLEKGIENFERAVLSQQEEERMEAKVVGIVGVGGVGKTTLAKEFFNRKRSEYGCSSFLFDVREKAATESLNSLQKQLIVDLKHRDDIKFERCEEGIGILKKLLSSCQALIILDNVDDVDQLNFFLPIKHDLDPKSLILVTTRDKHVLSSAGIAESSIYHLCGLDTSHSQELFCRHAFFRQHPLPGFENLVDEILAACDGLPLSLKLFGALVRGHDKAYWEDVLKELPQTHTQSDEKQNIFESSYCSLSTEEQHMFLDIACFFIGKNRDTAIRIWEGSHWKGLAGLQNLEDKCLVEPADSENMIRMHDQLRDFGRNKATSLGSMPRRLCCSIKDVHDLLEQSSSSVIQEVRGIRMPHRSSIDDSSDQELFPSKPEMLLNDSSSHEKFQIRNLQLLEAEDSFVECILSKVEPPQSLIWLCWNDCPDSSLPLWIPMEHLRVLGVAGSKLTRLWQHESQAPLQLRELNIKAPLLELPRPLGQLKHLEKIVVEYPVILQEKGLATLPDEICALCSLKYLELKDFHDLRILPNSFGNLTNLQHINLCSSFNLQFLPDSFGNLTMVKCINLSYCSNLAMLPDSFGNLRSLQHINLYRCKNLKVLPDSFGNLRNLQGIDLGSCRRLHMLPTSTENLTNLQRISLRDCRRLKMLPKSMGNCTNLEIINLHGCCDLKMLPDSFGDLENLKHIDVSHCKSLERIPNISGTLTNLSYANSACCSSIEIHPSDITNSKELWLNNCEKLQCFPPLLSVPVLNQLTKLKLLQCGIQYLPEYVMNMNNLEYLKIEDCPLRELPFKNVEGGSNKGMCQLKMLHLSSTNISEVSFPQGVCPNLQNVKILNCNDLVEVGALPATLTELSFLACPSLRKIAGPCSLPKLRHLSIMRCEVLEELPGFETLISLRGIQLEECHNLGPIQGLVQLTKLQSLYVCRCFKIQELLGVEHCRSLKKLRVSECSKLQEVEKVLEQLH